MQAWARRMAPFGTVIPFDYPYMKQGRKTPDRQPVLIQAHRAVLEEAQAAHPGAPVVLAGKSMGSRMGCHLAVDPSTAANPPVAIICFGYPLRSPKGDLRDEVLRALRTPVLFVQGSKDPLCPLPALEGVRAVMTAPSELFVVEGGNHSLEVGAGSRRATGKTQEDWDQEILGAIGRFLSARALEAAAAS